MLRRKAQHRDRHPLILGRLFVILIGYLLACLTASVVIQAIEFAIWKMALAETATPIVPYSFTVPYTAIFVFLLALIPASIMIFLAEYFGWRDRRSYAVTGAAIPIIVLGVLGLLGVADQHSNEFSPFVEMCGGLFGALTYWLIAGRNAGIWSGRAKGLHSKVSA